MAAHSAGRLATEPTADGGATLPHIVLIYMDDMTAWSLTSSQVSTPNLDRLRRRGTQYETAYNQGSLEPAVCTPARQMLMSGLTVFDAATRFIDVPRLGRTLTDAGYNSYFTGKWHNQREALERDYRTVGPWAGGMLGTIDCEDDAYGRPHPGDTWSPSDEARGGHWMRNDAGQIQHSSERWTDSAVGFLDQAPTEDPVFVHLAYHAPHDPRQAPQEFLDRYPTEAVRVPPNAVAEHPFDNGSLTIRDELLAPHPRTPDAVQLHRSEYFALLSHADREIGRVLDAADAVSARSGRDTIVVFSGDHGLALGEHGLLGKQNLYEHSTRVPMVWAGPGIPEGHVRVEPVYSGSIYATLCDLAGIDAPGHIQFSSLRETMQSPRAEGAPAQGPATSQPIFTAYGMDQRALRRGSMKLIEYAVGPHTQLFDLDNDPWEQRNLADDRSYADLISDLRAELAEHQRALHDPVLAGDR